MPNLNVIVAFAADHLDTEARQASLEDRVDDLSKLSQRVNSGDDLFKLWAEAKGGRVISIGKGDGRIEVGADHLEELSQLKDQFNQTVGSTCSVGVGAKLSEAEKALTYAKKTGGNSIELYTEELEQDLANLDEPEGESKLFDSFFDKAEHELPALNRSTVKNAGGGMSGAHKALISGPEQQKQPERQEDEHSENEALAGQMESQESQPDMSDAFGQLAEESEQKEGEEKQAKADQAQQDEEGEKLRGAVVDVLKQFKEQAPLWEQLKEAQPDAYKTLTSVIQAMVALARQAFSGEEQDPGEEQKEAPVQKSEDLMPGGKGDNKPDSKFKDKSLRTGIRTEMTEHGLDVARAKEIAKDHLTEDPEYYKGELPSVGAAPAALHSQVEPFLGALKGLPKEGPSRGKLITQHMNHAPFLSALQAHPQGKQVHAMLTGFLNSKANAGVGVGAKTVVKAALEAGKTGRHQVVLPVGSQIDSAPNASRKVGRIKIRSVASGKTKWRSVRAGLVMDPEGNPTSSRNPSGGVGK